MVQPRFPFLAFCLLVALISSSAYAKTLLQSPWDSHPVALTDTPYECPPAPQLPRDFATNSYYTDAQHSIPDPVLKKKYEDSVAAIEDFSRALVKAADAFQTTGSGAAAQCVVTSLESAAKGKAFTGTMDGHEASYVQGWNLGAWAVAYLKVRGSGLASKDQAHTITSWMRKLAEENRAYYEAKRRAHSGPNDSDNNHVYWAGFAIAAAGMANDDHGLFNWGVDAYKHGIHDIQDDGTLPMELGRGQMALHYHLYALAPLMMLAEFGETNGLDLYAERDYAIKRLVARCISGLQDPSFFQKKTGDEQVTTQGIEAWQISWAQYYTRRFPDPKISQLMSQAPWLNYTMLGGLPPP
jgi:poly(beta-D-mannuronate) lyase